MHMSPYVALKIEDFVPSIYYFPDDGMSRKMTHQEENILDRMIQATQNLNLDTSESEQNRDNLYEELLSKARKSDEFYLDEFNDINTDSIEFNIQNLFDDLMKYASELEQEYRDVDMSEEIRRELDQNQSGDIFASMLESLYLRLIAKTLLAASDLGIGEIHLQDSHKNARLAEKMSNELQKMGLELIID